MRTESNDEGTIISVTPSSTIKLKWGQDISKENIQRLRAGEMAILYNQWGVPHAFLLMDYFGAIWEQRIILLKWKRFLYQIKIFLLCE